MVAKAKLLKKILTNVSLASLISSVGANDAFASAVLLGTRIAFNPKLASYTSDSVTMQQAWQSV
ncbi:MAG: hypothetical protein RCG15_03025 [Candidatus Rickettsia vulgarisii]